MTLLSQRTVASQIATQLRANIEKGVWRDWLPTERVLCQMIQASRNTVRAAINQLKAEGLVKAEKPAGNRIIPIARRPRKGSQPKSIGIIVPAALHSLRPLIALWIDELKDMLLEEGCVLRVHDGLQYYHRSPAAALSRLVKQNNHDAWVLVLSSQAMQQWFARSGLRCLVAGSPYQGIDLPFCDFDYRAICRHAVGVLLRLGHRRIAFLNHDYPRAGEVAGELGFNEAVRASSRPGVVATVAYHHDDVESVHRALERLRRSHAGFPSALVVSSSYAYLSAITLLAHQRLRVPQDVSLISRDDDPLLKAIYPTPARYTVSPQAFARRLIGPVSRLIRGLPVARSETYFLPKFAPGGSTAPPAASG